MLHATARKICSFKMRLAPGAPCSLRVRGGGRTADQDQIEIQTVHQQTSTKKRNEESELVPEFWVGEDDAVEHFDSNCHS